MDIVALIENFGFPIACVVAIGWYLLHVQHLNRTDMKDMQARMYDQLEELSSTNRELSDIGKALSDTNKALSSTNTLLATEINVKLDTLLDGIDNIKEDK